MILIILSTKYHKSVVIQPNCNTFYSVRKKYCIFMITKLNDLSGSTFILLMLFDRHYECEWK